MSALSNALSVPTMIVGASVFILFVLGKNIVIAPAGSFGEAVVRPYTLLSAIFTISIVSGGPTYLIYQYLPNSSSTDFTRYKTRTNTLLFMGLPGSAGTIWIPATVFC